MVVDKRIREMEDVFKSLADATRLRILLMLEKESMCVHDIFSRLKISQPAVSHHLKILKQAGIVTGEKKGKWVVYSLNDENKVFVDWVISTLKK